MAFKINVMTVDEDCQFLKLTLKNTTILHDEDDVQTIMKLSEDDVTFNVFIGGEFDTSDFNSARFTAYLMQDNNTVLSASTCTFNIYSVGSPGWVETLLHTQTGSVQGNNYFFADITEATLGVLLDGDPTLMVEAVIVRLGKTYKNRVYLNQLGIYDSFFKLKRQVNIIEYASDQVDGKS